MRRVLWTLAVVAVVGAAIRVGTAADDYYSSNRSSYDSKPTASSVEYFSRSGQSGVQTQAAAPTRYTRSMSSPVDATQAPPKLKNYHRELYGTPKPLRSTVRTPTPQQSAFRDPAVRPAGASTQSASRRYPMTLDDGRMPSESTSPAIKHANYRSGAANHKSENIRQIRGRTAAPFPTANQVRSARTTPSLPAIPAAAPVRRPLPIETSVAAPSRQEIQAAIRNSSRRPRVTVQASKPAAQEQGFALATVSTAKTPVVSIEWIKKSEINVGQECRCQLVITNQSKVAAADVVVDAFFPKSVRLTHAEPQPLESKDHLSWKFELLAAGEKKSIDINMIPSQRGELATNATVRFTGTSLAIFKVEEPLLNVVVSGPQEVKVGEPAPHKVTLTNPGTGVAQNVSIEVELPKGLEHARGERLAMEIGALNPGEERTITLSLTATEGGLHEVKIKAKADSDLLRIAASTIDVVAPSLQLDLKGPALRYLNRTARYTVSVRNDGRAATNNVRVMHQIPEGFRFLGADKGGKFDYDARTVSWFVGRLDSEQAVELKVQLKPIELGAFLHNARATSEHGALADTSFETQIEGAASLVLEIVDLDDPVEVDAETAYEIRVRNNGSKAASKVGISCEIPGGVEVVGAEGPSSHIAESGLVVFKAIDELAPGKTAVYRVKVRGTTEGSHRFRARLTSESILEPLVFEELTKFYAD